MNVLPTPGGAVRADTTHRTCVIDVDDYTELVKIAQDHAALLKMVFKDHPNADKYRQAYWSRRICLTTEEALAVDCVEYRAGLTIRYIDKPIVVSRGVLTVVGDRMKVYSPGHAVVDEFSISSIAEMYHDETRKCLKIVSRTEGALEVGCEDDATLRSMYYNVVVRHRRRGDGMIDPVAQTQKTIRKVGEAMSRGGARQPLSVDGTMSMELVKAISTQQDLLDRVAEPPAVRGDRAHLTGPPHHHMDLRRRREGVASPQQLPGTRQLSPAWRRSGGAAPFTPPPLGATPGAPGGFSASPAAAGPAGLLPDELASYLLLGKRPSIRGSRRALVVTCTYPHAPITLPDASAHAQTMQELLSARGFAGEKVVLTDVDAGGAQPTKANILKALSWLVEGARAGDSLFFSFHGHGGDRAGAAHDVPEGLCPADYKAAGVLTGDEIRSAIALPHGVKLTVISDLGTGGSILSMPWSVVRGQRGFHLADGGLPHALPGGTLLLFSGLKDGCGGKESIVPAYARALNYHPEASAAQLLSAMHLAMQAYPVSPVLSSYHPVLASMHAGLGCLVTDYIDAVDADRASLSSYHRTDVGCWQPDGPLDTHY